MEYHSKRVSRKESVHKRRSYNKYFCHVTMIILVAINMANTGFACSAASTDSPNISNQATACHLTKNSPATSSEGRTFSGQPFSDSGQDPTNKSNTCMLDCDSDCGNCFHYSPSVASLPPIDSQYFQFHNYQYKFRIYQYQVAIIHPPPIPVRV